MTIFPTVGKAGIKLSVELKVQRVTLDARGRECERAPSISRYRYHAEYLRIAFPWERINQSDHAESFQN